MGRKSKPTKSCPLAFLKPLRLCRIPTPNSSRVPSALEEQLEVLDTFAESVDELFNSAYLKQIRKDSLLVKRQWTGESLAVTTTSPEHEAAKAVVLTLRMFCQDNDATSLGNVAAMLGTMNADTTALSNFSKSRANFNTYLNSAPSIGFPDEADANTRRKIWDTFLYGMFAHAQIAKRRTIKSWEAAHYGEDIRMQFDSIIVEFIKAVTIMSSACKTIAEAKRQPAS